MYLVSESYWRMSFLQTRKEPGKMKRCETRNRGSSRGEGSGVRPGRWQCTRHTGKTVRSREGSKIQERVSNLFSAPRGQGAARSHFPPVEESRVKFCFQRLWQQLSRVNPGPFASFSRLSPLSSPLLLLCLSLSSRVLGP